MVLTDDHFTSIDLISVHGKSDHYVLFVTVTCDIFNKNFGQQQGDYANYVIPDFTSHLLGHQQVFSCMCDENLGIKIIDLKVQESSKSSGGRGTTFAEL